MKDFISIPEIAERHFVGDSLLRKKIKALGMVVVPAYREETRKATTAIAWADYQRLLKVYPMLTLGVAGDEVSLSFVAKTLARLRGWKSPDIKSVIQMCRVRGISIVEVKFGTRPQQAIDKVSYELLLLEAEDTIIV